MYLSLGAGVRYLSLARDAVPELRKLRKTLACGPPGMASQCSEYEIDMFFFYNYNEMKIKKRTGPYTVLDFVHCREIIQQKQFAVRQFEYSEPV